MSTNIDRDQTFLGVPLLKVRNVLKAWRYGRTDAHHIALRKDVDLNPCTVMMLLEELRDRGLIEDQECLGPIDGLTEVGQALAFASGKKRTPKNRARLVQKKFFRCLSGRQCA